MDKIVIIGYAIFLLVGAFMGAKAGSKISLIMGLISSALVFSGYFLLAQNARDGYLAVIVVSAALSVMFLMRYLKTHKFMPSGMLLAVSVLVLVVVIKYFLKTP